MNTQQMNQISQKLVELEKYDNESRKKLKEYQSFLEKYEALKKQNELLQEHNNKLETMINENNAMYRTNIERLKKVIRDMLSQQPENVSTPPIPTNDKMIEEAINRTINKVREVVRDESINYEQIVKEVSESMKNEYN